VRLRKEIVVHTPPEERLVDLSPAELLILMKQIEAHLQQGQPPAADIPPVGAALA
jgi:hypothetical protein